MNSEDISGAPSSSTHINATLVYLFVNEVTRNLRISGVRRLLLDGNPKGCEVAEHIATKVELNPQMLSTFKTQNTSEA